MRRRRRRDFAVTLVGLIGMCIVALAVPRARAQASAASSLRAWSEVNALDEVVVTGERTGPGLWHLSRGKSQFWILGTVTPLPKDVTWRSSEVERVLGKVQRVLLSKPLQIGITRAAWLLLTRRDLFMVHGSMRLHDVLAPDLYVRFAALRNQYARNNDKWERYRPILASAFLQESALKTVGLSSRLDLAAEVRLLADKHRVAVDEVSIVGVRDALEVLKNLPAAAENTCVSAALETVESGLPRLVERAHAWTRGDIERIQALPPTPQVDACVAALSTDSSASGKLMTQMRRTWLAGLEAALRQGDVLAVVNIDQLQEHGGLLDDLRAAGFEVEAPH